MDNAHQAGAWQLGRRNARGIPLAVRLWKGGPGIYPANRALWGKRTTGLNKTHTTGAGRKVCPFLGGTIIHLETASYIMARFIQSTWKLLPGSIVYAHHGKPRHSKHHHL